MAHEYRDMPSAGTSLEMEIGYAFVQIPGTTDITWDGYKRNVRNPTWMASPAVVKKPAMADFGQIKSKVFYDPNDVTHQTIRDRIQQTPAYASAHLDSFKLHNADGYATPSYAEITGFVSEFSIGYADPETGTSTADMTIEVTEIVDFVDGSPAE